MAPAHWTATEWWGDRHRQIVDRIGQGNVDLIFVGDSITQGWERTGASLWETYYVPRRAVNMGFDGDNTQHVLWRLEQGEIEGISPKVAVVLIGVNNLWNNSTAEIANGIQAVCLNLRSRLPETKVLLLAMFPCQEHPGAAHDKIIEVNKRACRIADGDMIHYLDIGCEFLRPDNTLSADLMPDFLHPNAKGYEVWAKAMEPLLVELMGESVYVNSIHAIEPPLP